MYHERLITGVAATLGAIAVVFTVVAVTGSPVAFPVAFAFAASALLMYDQLSGRMAGRVYRRVEQHARVSDATTADGGRGSRGAREHDADGSAERGRRRQAAGRQRGGFDAGPREEWTPPRDGATVGEAASGARGGGRGQRRSTGNQRRSTAPGADETPNGDDGPTAEAAYRRLGVEPGADEATVREAYREKVKQVHPDTGDGDEDDFMAVKAAYERLTD